MSLGGTRIERLVVEGIVDLEEENVDGKLDSMVLGERELSIEGFNSLLLSSDKLMIEDPVRLC